ncbi:nuclear transport factor 2 family protein [Bradyrhizobium lablabi]|uniref:nuclear transport factor 2 family protein n=1 Tax=Bradyrhizobium lablabi TaxID=722472 RepID=UPI001BA69566|nr:nuclear transport factor 2 family protein [Bradyrhizobium lablabi]MBR1120701.1 nuclear transport factor 2 family protein [Bradyrhizobium lablabi]
MGSTAEDIASGVMAKWTAAFSKLDADALSSLYSKHALFFGSNPNLYRGRDGVASYFRGLPRWQSQSVRFTEVVAEQVNADLVNFAGIAHFAFDGDTLSVKMTWVIGREDFDWKIVSHHASSKAPLI